MSKLNVIILAAGQSKRMKSKLPKTLHKVAGLPMLGHVINAAKAVSPDEMIIVTAPHMDDVKATFRDQNFAIQTEQKGTAHAVLAGLKSCKNLKKDLLVLFGDNPLLQGETLQKLVAEKSKQKLDLILLAFRDEPPHNYGRLVLDSKGNLTKIIETKDANKNELEINLCNSGVMLIGEKILPLLDKIKSANSQKEFYLTDLIGLAVKEKAKVGFLEGPLEELLGVNDRIELAQAEEAFQYRLRMKALENGVTLQDPTTVFFSHDTKIDQDVIIGPNVIFGPKVSIASGSEIRAFCHIEGAKIGHDVTVGPFARIRPDTILEDISAIGNFVEVKNSKLGKGAKASHLSYLGDATIGFESNIGAGTITCNYDGFVKSHTDIGDRVFVGSNTSLIAPVTIGDGAIIGAGSVITQNVETNALALARAEQKEVTSGGAIIRARKQNEKDSIKAAKKKR